MERKNFKRKESLPTLFSEGVIKRTRKEGMVKSFKKASNDVEEVIIPLLKEIGYDGRLVTSKIVNKKLKIKEHEDWSTVHPRTMLKQSGMYLEIWPQYNPKYKIVVMPFVVESTKPKHLGNRPRFNLNPEYVRILNETSHKNIHSKLVHHFFFVLDLHFLIVTKTGMFWLEKYNNIPYEKYYMTYRNDPKVLDRIAVKAEVQQKGVFRSVKHLRDALLTYQYYFSKNNVYEFDLRSSAFTIRRRK